MEMVRASSQTIFLALLAALALAFATFVAVAGMPGLAQPDAGNSWHSKKIAGNSWHSGSTRILAGNSWH